MKRLPYNNEIVDHSIANNVLLVCCQHVNISSCQRALIFVFYPIQIAKDARECVQECVSEFISFITSEASDRCHAEKRKTINGEDILYAMTTLGFDNYVEPLKLYLQKYREVSDKHKLTTCFNSKCMNYHSLNKYLLMNELV